MILSEMIAEEARSVYTAGKEFIYDHMNRDKVVPINKNSDTRINIKVNAPRRSMKGILLLFMEPYTAGTRDSEKYIFPNLNKVRVTISGSPNKLYNEGIESQDIWAEVCRFFMKEKYKSQHMTLKKFYTNNKFGKSRNAWQQHLSRKHHRWRPAGNWETPKDQEQWTAMFL